MAATETGAGVTLRPGKEVAACETLARLIWSTAPEQFSYFFGGDGGVFSRLLPAEWEAPAGLHCAADSTVACSGETVLGLVNAFPSHEIEHRVFLTLRRYDATLDASARTRINAANAEIGWLYPPAPRDSLMVFNLAVSPEARGRGLGRILLQEAEEFYQRLGYEAVVESRLLRPEPAAAMPPQLRMIKPLG